jgi:hypothetical protein
MEVIGTDLRNEKALHRMRMVRTKEEHKIRTIDSGLQANWIKNLEEEICLGSKKWRLRKKNRWTTGFPQRWKVSRYSERKYD